MWRGGVDLNPLDVRDDDVAGTGFNVWLHKIIGGFHIVGIDDDLDRTLNGFGVTSNRSTMVVKDLIFVLEDINGATDKVPDVSVFGGDTQR